MKWLWIAFACVSGCASTTQLRKAEEDGERMRFELAETYLRKGAYAAAIPLLRREVAARPANPAARTLYGIVLREQGLYPQAERELQAALAIAPRSARTFDALAVLYDLMRRPVEAERAHRAAVASAPGDAMYWNNLGFSLYVARKDGEAVAALERALAIDPALAVAYNNLGFAYGRRGDDAGAERCFRSSGGELSARTNMAIVYEQRGESERAARLRGDVRLASGGLDGRGEAARRRVEPGELLEPSEEPRATSGSGRRGARRSPGTAR